MNVIILRCCLSAAMLLAFFMVPRASRAEAVQMSIAPPSLETQAFNIGTYAGPVWAVLMARSAQQWVCEGEPYDQSTPKEFAHLVGNGFEDGVIELSGDGQREGVYDAQVFATVAGAVRETQHSIRYAERHFEQKGLERSPVAGLPGGAIVGSFVAGKHGANGNVFFNVGRCAFLVADEVRGASSRSEGWMPVVEEARRVASQAAKICA